jgi:hypothetical protein
MVKTYKLIVSVTENSIDILKYMSRTIKQINAMGIKIRIEKVGGGDLDDALVGELKRLGVTRLPALLSPKGKAYIGKKEITTLFDTNIKNLKNRGRVAPTGSTAGRSNAFAGGVESNDADLSNYWAQQLWEGTDDGGKRIPRKDADEADDESKEIQDRMRAYETRVPKHRTAVNDDPFAHRPSAVVDNPYGDSGRAFQDDLPDNIASDQPYEHGINLPLVDDETDRKMLAAWIDNNSTSDY